MKKGYILNIISGLLFATSCIFVHFLSPFGFTSMQMTAMRGIVAGVIMAICVLLYDKKKFKTKLKELGLFFASGVFMFLISYFYYASMELTTTATAVVLMYTAPIFVTIYSVLFFGEKMTGKKLGALACMIVGAALVSGIIGGMKFNALGIIFGLLSGISYSVYNILIKVEMRRKDDPMTAMLYCYIAMGVCSLFAADFPKMGTITSQNPLVILPLILGIGIFTCVLPYFLYTLSLKALPAGTASAMGMIDPMAATIYSVLFFKEPLTIASLCGIILIIGSAIVLSRGDEKKQAAKAESVNA